MQTSTRRPGLAALGGGERIGRRRALGLAGLVGVGVLTGCSGGDDSGGSGLIRERATCVARPALERRADLGGLPLVYEADQSRSRFSFDSGFVTQLEDWLAFYRETSTLDVDQVWTYGSWIDGSGECDSWHHSGRAFDLTRLRLAGREFVSCRHDQWGGQTTDALAASLRSYWCLAASLHLHFASVLTYLYDAAHANHIHADNGQSQTRLSRFRTGSRVQVQAVQAICTYVWDTPVELTGRWDSATEEAGQTVLRRIGTAGSVDDGLEHWHAFLRASVARAS